MVMQTFLVCKLSKRAEEEEEEEKKVVSQRYCQLIFVMVMIIFDDVVGTDLSCLLAKQESRRYTSPKDGHGGALAGVWTVYGAQPPNTCNADLVQRLVFPSLTARLADVCSEAAAHSEEAVFENIIRQADSMVYLPAEKICVRRVYFQH